MPPPLLTAHDATDHVHLVVGSNPLANARCLKSLEVGAKPILLAPDDGRIFYGLQQKIDEGLVRWLKREAADDDLRNLGRDEVDNVVDAVFVTLAKTHPLSNYQIAIEKSHH